MGDKADDILSTLGLNEEDKKKYRAVRDAFEKFFICKHNVIYERARFNKRCQEPGESAESFISAVYKLAEHCQYGVLQEEMIRDRLVVGIRHHGLSESTQMNSELTLAKAIQKIRQHEEIKKQQPTVREAASTDQKEANVDMMKFKKKPQRHNQTGKSAHGKGQKELHKGQKSCGRCGKSPAHSLNNCAARDVECRKCHKRGHYAAVCRSGRVETIQEQEVDTVFLGEVSMGNKSKTWRKTLKLNGQQTTFKLDTGAEVTAIPATVHSEKEYGILTRASKVLCGPSNNTLKVHGQFNGVTEYKNQKTIWVCHTKVSHSSAWPTSN